MPASDQKVENKPGALKDKKEVVLLRWKSPSRPFKRRDREYYTTIGAIVFLLAVILLFLKEWMLIAVMIAFAFVSYVLASVQPEEVEQMLTSKGVWTGGKLYPWEGMARYWLAKKWGQRKIVFELKKGFPSRLYLMLGGQDEGELKKVVEKFLKMDKPELTLIDKAAGWLQKKVPLENG